MLYKKSMYRDFESRLGGRGTYIYELCDTRGQCSGNRQVNSGETIIKKIILWKSTVI